MNQETITNIIDKDFYGGMSGIELDGYHLEIGEELKFSKTSVDLSASYMAVFETEPSKSNSESKKGSVRVDTDGKEWVDVTAQVIMVPGNQRYRITSELYIPAKWFSNQGTSQLDLIRRLMALIRIDFPTAIMPLIANVPFESVLKCNQEEAKLFPFETQSRGIILVSTEGNSLNCEGLGWVKNSWKTGLELTQKHKELNLAIQALDQAHFIYDWALGMLLIWAALEELFSNSRNELRFRLSAFISSFLEPPGAGRRLLQKEIAKLYDARSAAAHGRSSFDRKNLFDSMMLLRRVIKKIITENQVPNKESLEVRLFGG